MPKTAAPVEVRIVEGAVRNHEGRAFYAGHSLAVTEADAAALEAAGAAERVKPKPRPKLSAARRRTSRAR